MIGASYSTLLLERQGAVLLIRLNRPEALNALNNQVMDDLTAALGEAEGDDEVGCIVLTGSDKAFASGADIKEMQTKTYAEAYRENFVTRNWEAATRCR
jgi:enoyl-CoA hydratase/carnithine racemase